MDWRICPRQRPSFIHPLVASRGQSPTVRPLLIRNMVWRLDGAISSELCHDFASIDSLSSTPPRAEKWPFSRTAASITAASNCIPAVFLFHQHHPICERFLPPFVVPASGGPDGDQMTCLRVEKMRILWSLHSIESCGLPPERCHFLSLRTADERPIPCCGRLPEARLL